MHFFVLGNDVLKSCWIFNLSMQFTGPGLLYFRIKVKIRIFKSLFDSGYQTIFFHRFNKVVQGADFHAFYSNFHIDCAG